MLFDRFSRPRLVLTSLLCDGKVEVADELALLETDSEAFCHRMSDEPSQGNDTAQLVCASPQLFSNGIGH